MRQGNSVSSLGPILIGILAFFAASAHAQPMVTLEAGDLIVLDVLDDAVYHVDPATGNKTTIISGPLVMSPRGVAVSPEGMLFVSDTFNEWLIRVDPFSGAAAFLFQFPIPPASVPDPAAALTDAESDWDIFVIEADQQQIFRIDPVLAQFGGVEFDLVGTRFPIGLARDPTDQTLIVADKFADISGEFAGIHRVDPATASQTSILLSDQFISLRRVAVQSDGDIFVTDRGGSGASGNEAVWRIPPGSTVPQLFGSFGDSFDDPQGIAVDPNTDVVYVTDYTTDELYSLGTDGNSKTVIADGFSGPIDVVVVPTLTPRDHDEFLISEANPGGTSGQVYRADSATDSRTPVAASGGATFTDPRAMAFEHPDDDLATGAIYVIDGPSKIVRRDLATGSQAVISEAGEFDDLSDIAVEFGVPLGSIVVTDRFDGQVIRVDPVGGAQSVLNSIPIPGKPTSIVVDRNGSLIVTATELVDDADPSDDSGLFRVNPLTGEVVHFRVFIGVAPVKFLDPFALAIDPTSDLYLIDKGGIVEAVPVPATMYLVQGTSGPFASAGASPLSTAVDPSLPNAVAMIVDGNRDPVVAFDAAEPSRLDVLLGNAATLMVGGNFNLATDLLFEDMPAPGDPVDTDGDSIPDGFDNCPLDPNPLQEDADGDGDGDECQLFDVDLDGWSDNFGDNCPFFPNPDQTDTDGDGVGDVCDNCPADPNAFPQADFDGDGLGDACDDSDTPAGDGIIDSIDNCPADPNPLQEDSDADGVGDVCDNCPDDFDADQSDLNEDGFGDVCQPGDSDGDGIPDDGGPGSVPCNSNEGVGCDDNCPNDPNPSQSDLNDDGFGDVCQDDLAGPDSDFDGWPDSSDNCPDNFNPSQSDLNEDGVGDICQDALAGPDFDFDGIPDDGGPAVCANGVTVNCDDNCPENFNPTQSDLNEDGEGDACQSGDLDNDGIPDDGGPAPCADGVTIGCDDNCPIAFNPSQSDLNGDLIGDACQPNDEDGDGWPRTEDNCPYYPNPNQNDVDMDGIGDACDNNTDGDGLVDILDNCPFVDNIGQEDIEDGDGAGDACDNCLTTPNAILQGTCFTGDVGALCLEDSECDFEAILGVCSRDQEDQDSDGIGDVCDPTALPEPGQLLMLLPALGVLALLHRRRSAAIQSR